MTSSLPRVPALRDTKAPAQQSRSCKNIRLGERNYP